MNDFYCSTYFVIHCELTSEITQKSDSWRKTLASSLIGLQHFWKSGLCFVSVYFGLLWAIFVQSKIE